MINTQNILGNPRIMAAAAALFQHGRKSPHYIRAIRALDAVDKATVTLATPEEVQAVRTMLGVQPWETR